MGCGASNEEGSGKENRAAKGNKNQSESDNPTAQYPSKSKDDGPKGNGSGTKYKKGDGGENGKNNSNDDERGPKGKAAAPTPKTNGTEKNGDDGENAGPLSQGMLVDLRTKAAKEGGSSVQRWVDSIAEPEEKDSVDVFDPLRRHFISMDSLHQKGEMDELI